MTIDELINHLNEWKSKHGGDCVLQSDFGDLSLEAKPDVVLDINNTGTLAANPGDSE